MRFVVNTIDPALYINSSGQVGIGTDNPNHELTVYGDEPNFRMTHTGSTNRLNSFYANVDGTGVKFNSYQEVTTTRRPFIFSQYTTEVMRIDGSGKVGIGTVTPGTLLHLSSATPAIRLTDIDTEGPLHCDIESVSGDLYLDTGSVHRDVIMSSAGRTNEIAKFTGDGQVAIGGNPRALRLTVRAADSITAGVNEGTISNAIAMFYGGSRNTIVADKEIIDTTIIHIKGQILDTDDTNNSTTGTHSTGKIVFSGRRATGAQSIIESATVWNRAAQTAGSELKFYTAPVSSNGGDAAVERLKISNSGYMQMKNSAGSTFALLRNNAVADSSSMLGSIDFGTIDWDSSTAQIASYQDGAKDKASLRFYTQPSVGSGIQERLRIDSAGKLLLGTGMNSNSDGYKMSIKETSGENAMIIFLDTDNMRGGFCGIVKGANEVYTGTTNVDFLVGSTYANTTLISGDGSSSTGARRVTVQTTGEIQSAAGGFVSYIKSDVNVSVDTHGWSQNGWNTVVGTNVFSDSASTYLVNFFWSHEGHGSPYLVRGNFLWSATNANHTGAVGASFTPVQCSHAFHGPSRTFQFQGVAAGNVRAGLQARALNWDPSNSNNYGYLEVRATRIADDWL